MKFLLIACALVAALFIACGGDDDNDASTTPTRSAGETSSADASATGSATPQPTATADVLDSHGDIDIGNPLVQAVASQYLGLIPPVSFTDPISCAAVNEQYDEADADEREDLDTVNTGRICILLDSSTFDDTEATVAVGLYRSDTIDTLQFELQGGAWVFINPTQAPS